MLPFESEFFKPEQITYSPTANKYGIDNSCQPAHYENAIWLLDKIIEPLRKQKEFVISSWYRSEALNNHPEVRGSRKSDHMLGLAVDILPVRMDLMDFYNFIKDETKLPYKQLILEFNAWVHISYERTQFPRRQNLRAIRNASGAVEYLE